MKNIYTLFLCFLSFFCFSQEYESLDTIFKKLNSQKDIQITIDKPYVKIKKKYCLVPIYQNLDYVVYYPFYLNDLKLHQTVGRVSGGNILVYSKKYEQYLVLSYFAGEYIYRKDKKYMKLEFNFKGWDLVNNLSILLDNSLKPMKYIHFPPELNNIKSEIKDKTLTIQNIDNNKSYDVTLNTAFYYIPLYKLFRNFYLKNQEEYIIEPIEYLDSFEFLREEKICFCK